QEVLSKPEFEQLRQRVTVRYHLRALDPGETAAYINHRLKKAAIGTPMEFPAPVTDLIGRASQGLPRRINIIADAALLFGYGEDKAVIDVPLVEEVLAELQDTGVLPRPGMPAAQTPPPALAGAGMEAMRAGAPAVDAAADAATVAAIRALERELAEREARVATRERELAEQHRILTEQYRLMRMREAQTSVAATTAPWPPSTPPYGAPGAQAPPASPTATPTASFAATPVTNTPVATRPGPRTPVAAPAPMRPGTTPPAARPAATRPAVAGAQFTAPRQQSSATVWTRMWRGLVGLGKPLPEEDGNGELDVICCGTVARAHSGSARTRRRRRVGVRRSAAGGRIRPQWPDDRRHRSRRPESRCRQPPRVVHSRRRLGRGGRGGRCQAAVGNRRLRRCRRARHDQHLRPDAAPQNQGPGDVVHRLGGRKDRRAPARGHADRPRVDNLPGHDRGARPADARSRRPPGRRRF